MAKPKRSVCPQCEYILARCLCHTLRSINNLTQIIVLQHPSETDHALSTVRLMKKSFHNMKVFIGENFSEHLELNSILKDHQETTALIFPTDKSLILKSESNKLITHLLLLDGTWKKARKIYLLSTNLQKLNSYSLLPTNPSQYKIRASNFEDSVSTLEASVAALASIEADLNTKSLEDSFAAMIEFQIEQMGEEKFRKNYLKSED
jgi:DTW domain-containing protein YfiP